MTMTAQEEEDSYIVPDRRVIFPIGGSKAVTLPMDWIKFTERLGKKRLDEIYALADGVIVIAPKEYVEEFKVLLETWGRLTPSQKELLIKLGRQCREVTRKKLTKRDIKTILTISPEIRAYMMSETKSEPEVGPVVQPVKM